MTIETVTPEPVRFGLFYDMRNPTQWRRPFESLYREILDEISWAERDLGMDSVWVTEHHFVDDGYTPSPLVVLASIAARTKQMRLGTNLVIPALHDPIRLAEDAATLAILSDGRFDLGVGLGWLEADFAAFGQKFVNRVSLLEDTVRVLRRAFGGESIAFDSKRFYLPDVEIQPIPERPPLILMGAEKTPAIERVARIGDGLLSNTNTVHASYLKALDDQGKDPAEARIYAIQWMIVDEDPEATWARIGDHALYSLNRYADWGHFGPPENGPKFKHRDDLAGSFFQLWDADTAVRELTKLLRECPQIRDVHALTRLPGESGESSSSRLEYYARNVVPRVRAALANDSPEPPVHTTPAGLNADSVAPAAA